MSNTKRDDFRAKTRRQIGMRAGWLCSDPSCRRFTIGSTSDGEGEIDLGIAAHICAASPRGPRFDPEMTTEERKSATNGIWLCRIHAAAVDAKDSMFTVELLQKWKEQAEHHSWGRLLYAVDGETYRQSTKNELSDRIRAAAAADLEIFRQSYTWPATAILRKLRVQEIDEPISTLRLASALTALDDLVIVAEPGMGKTTTVFQIADAVLENGCASPIVVPLGDWSVNSSSLLEAILKRAAFGEISEGDFRTVAENPGVLLLLDGWNELDGSSRRRAATEIRRLEMELPNLNLLVTTRKQARAVPIDGRRVALQPLSWTEQIEIARALRADEGERLLDKAWLTDGVRELVTIPLYLTALLSLPEGGAFPKTKEEILRRLVTIHENDYQKAEAVRKVTHGLHGQYLTELGIIATRAANTTIVEAAARNAISDAGDALVANGQIAMRPEPHEVLEVLVNCHALIHISEPEGYSFQHQQIQEWYASHFVEQMICQSIDSEHSHDTLRTHVLDQRAWEEPILFACERMACGDEAQQAACSAAILAALDVDPMLAADMISRSADSVWQSAKPMVMRFIQRWHIPGRVDRAVRFMITSARNEFLEYVWPLMTHEDQQVRLAALSAGRRFRPSLLGDDGADRIAALSPKIRQDVLSEIVFNSGMDGIEFVAGVTKDDSAADVKISVVEALAFCGADSHVIDVLEDADDEIFDELAKRRQIDHITDDSVETRLATARARLRLDGISALDRISSVLDGPRGNETETNLAMAIAEVRIATTGLDVAVGLIHEVKREFPRAVAEGILRRVREGRELPSRAPELMAGGDFAFEEDALLEIALVEEGRDDRADAAASVLGPHAVGRMIDRTFELAEGTRDSDGKYDRAGADRHRAVQDRTRFVRVGHLLAAIGVRSKEATNHQLSELAGLICRHRDGIDRGRQPLDDTAQATIVPLVENWGSRLLASPDATRAQLASIAKLAAHAPSVLLLPILERLLDEDLRRWRAFKEQVRVDRSCKGIAVNEATTSWRNVYQDALLAIRSPETPVLMEKYLSDKEFGQSAALVLAGQYRAANEPDDGRLWKTTPDFSRITEARAARNTQPHSSSGEADTIFRAVERLIVEDGTDDGRMLAVSLATVAAALPHGERGDLITALIQMADRKSRAALITNLALSGIVIDVGLVRHGIGEVLEASEMQPWILGEGGELEIWLRLLPLTDSPSTAIDIAPTLPQEHHTLGRLIVLVEVLAHVPGDEAEDVLFRIAETDPRLYERRAWHDAVCSRGTLSAATRFVELITQGILDPDGRDMDLVLASLMDQLPDLRPIIYRALARSVPPRGMTTLAQAVANNPDVDGLLLLIRLHQKHNCALPSPMAILRAVNEKIPSETWKGSYDMVPVPADDLRRELFAMATDGGTNDLAAHYLTEIDEIRDTWGVPESERRHPDIESGKAWPIIASL